MSYYVKCSLKNKFSPILSPRIFFLIYAIVTLIAVIQSMSGSRHGREGQYLYLYFTLLWYTYPIPPIMRPKTGID